MNLAKVSYYAGLILYSILIFISLFAFLGFLIELQKVGVQVTLYRVISALATEAALIIMLIGLIRKTRGTFQFTSAYIILTSIAIIYRGTVLKPDVGTLIWSLALNVIFYLPILFNRTELAGGKKATFWLILGLVVGVLDSTFTLLGT